MKSLHKFRVILGTLLFKGTHYLSVVAYFIGGSESIDEHNQFLLDRSESESVTITFKKFN